MSVAEAMRALEARRNPILREFRRSWDRSLAGIDRFRATLADRPEPTSVRDEADDFLDDLARMLRRSS